MGIATFPAASASSKTRFFQSLTSSGSFTVPATVTSLNVTCIGSGGGGGGAGSYNNLPAVDGSAGNTTTFSTVSASGGAAGLKVQSTNEDGYGGPKRVGTAAPVNSGLGGGASFIAMQAVSTFIAGTLFAGDGQPGQILSGIITVTPGQVISYTIGAAGAGATSANATYAPAGGNGGSGRIDIEYWA